MKNQVTNKIIFLIIFSIFIGILACSNDKPIRIGFIAGLSGRGADLGVAGRNGVMLAIEQKNAAGGIDGRPLELIAEDDRQNSDIAKKRVTELIDQGVDVIIGPMTSSMAMAIVPIINERGVCMVSPTVTTTDLVDKDDNFIRVISTTKDYATINAAYQYQKLNHQNVAVIYDINNRAYTESWLNNFKSTFEGLGGKLVKTTGFKSSNDMVFYDIVENLIQSEADLILIITNAVDAALICQQIRKLDKNISIAMSEWASTERFIELAGSVAEGVYVAQFLDRNDESQQYQAFRNAYTERFSQEPGFAGIAGYDAGLVVIDALSRQKKNVSLKQTIIKQKKFQGVQQAITINQFGDADRKTFITVIKNGSYITIKK